MRKLISVSSLPYNDNILESLKIIEDSKADFLHLDLMDGSLTESSTFNYEIVKNINSKSTIVLDAHLMINEPLKIIDNFINAKCNIITVHVEAFKNKNDLVKALFKIKKSGLLAGISLYPDTKLKEIKDYLNLVDLVLIMSVNIGKYGQKFIETSLDKIRNLRKIYNGLIEVDGGINLSNKEEIYSAGADILVVGGAFKNAEDKEEFIEKMRN